jgi:hypothetical protein
VRDKSEEITELKIKYAQLKARYRVACTTLIESGTYIDRINNSSTYERAYHVAVAYMSIVQNTIKQINDMRKNE